MFFVLPIWSQLSANVRTAAAADRAQLRDATAAAARPGRLGVDNAAANLEIPRDKIIAPNKIKKIINTWRDQPGPAGHRDRVSQQIEFW